MSQNDPASRLSRRAFFSVAAGAATVSLSGCVNVPTAPGPVAFTEPMPAPAMPPSGGDGASQGRYGAISDHGYEIPAVPVESIPSNFLRREVDDPTGEAPGTIVVDTSQHYLYLVQPGGRAMRYGVGLGRAGFDWAGRAQIERKQVWPKWFPPADMIDREPELEQYRPVFDEASQQWEGGMEPGISNPLGARALYIYEDGKDTLYRVHGSPEWWTIGKSVSSGCVRMINQDVIDLYDRVPLGSPILVTNGLGMTVDAVQLNNRKV